jgi:hypothetical protein
LGLGWRWRLCDIGYLCWLRCILLLRFGSRALISQEAPLGNLTPVVSIYADVIELRPKKLNLPLKSGDNLVVFWG